MEHYLDPEEQIQCPYNSAHLIRRKVFNTHLVKCRKANPDIKLVPCDFNVTHWVEEPCLQHHHENCPDRKKIETKFYVDDKTDLNKYPVRNTYIPSDENWDDENVPTYNPQKTCLSKEVIRHLDVASAGKKKNFRMEERQRMSQFTNNTNRPPKSDFPSSQKVELPETRQFSDAINENENTPNSVEQVLMKTARAVVPKKNKNFKR
ncbi:gametocyte-specific factor 1 homolog [Diabrotica virgifera virgifera]|uniref:Gametocyte-specific factor 1 homolog n=1 Tax=Diabrotica virgifera virgifera TaxID=50390 RepID=A0A6P7GRD4_DIAVI|nr:gametocyte-specific factor 1 homolog [Diabrotica virgifera virgifera]